MSLCADRIARVTLELGGKSAAVLADDVDLAQVLPTLVPGGVGHCGQVCIALTRILAPRSRYGEIVDALGAAFSAIHVGDPLDPETEMGPLALERQRARVEEYIAVGRSEARLVAGGGRPAGLDRGWYVEPTLFADVDNRSRIAQEEVFGPVVVVIPYDDDADAIRIANESRYGLSGAVYSADPERALTIARQIRTGTVSINASGICTTQPFGGYKRSGIGREGGPEGLAAYQEVKQMHLPDPAGA